jgi:hypothetical protein
MLRSPKLLNEHIPRRFYVTTVSDLSSHRKEGKDHLILRREKPAVLGRGHRLLPQLRRVNQEKINSLVRMKSVTKLLL